MGQAKPCTSFWMITDSGTSCGIAWSRHRIPFVNLTTTSLLTIPCGLIPQRTFTTWKVYSELDLQGHIGNRHADIMSFQLEAGATETHSNIVLRGCQKTV